MKVATLAMVGFASLGCGLHGPRDPTLLIQMPETSAKQQLNVSCPSFAVGGTIPTEFTPQAANRRPQIVVSPIPPGTKTLAMIVEDPDAPGSRPFVHWIVYGPAPA